MSIPLQQTLDWLKPLFLAPVMELFHYVLTSTYFNFNGQFFWTEWGGCQGSPPILCHGNFLMEGFEKLALAAAPLKPSLYKCYIDDTLVVWPHGLEQLHEFVLHLNSFLDTTKFTIELKVEGQWSFLDIRLIRNTDDSITCAVFWKPTHMNLYLSNQNFHHPVHKFSARATLVDRAHKITKIAFKRNWIF